MKKDDEAGKKERKQKKQEKEKSKSEKRLNSLSNKLNRLMGRGSSSQSSPSLTETEGAAPTGSSVTERIAAVIRPEPRVLHGYTLTKEITFRDVCYAIRDSAFITSDLPVIVSLEVHACLEQQQTMVEIMQEAWKGLLVDMTPELEACNRLPSPGELKRKILVKAKWAPPTGDNASDEADDPNGALEHTKSAEEKDGHSESGSLATAAPTSSQKKPSKTLHALSRLAVYTRAYRFKNFTQPGNQASPTVSLKSDSATYHSAK